MAFRGVVVWLAVWAGLLPASAQDSSITLSRLRLITRGIVASATFRFVDQGGATYESPREAPSGGRVRPESPYTDWRYWNGVLNIAMIRAGEACASPALSQWAIRNIGFSFDHYAFFEETYDGASKWEYPFAQRFRIEELDDCGAMGASVLEVHRRDPPPRYQSYIDETARFILQLTGSYMILFATAGLVYLVALLAFHRLVPVIGPVDLA